MSVSPASTVSAVLAPPCTRFATMSQHHAEARPSGDDGTRPGEPPAPAPSPALIHALESARGITWQATDDFREALCADVGELRRAGLGPVQMLLTVKRTLAHAPVSLVEQSVKWCIEAYYRPS